MCPPVNTVVKVQETALFASFMFECPPCCGQGSFACVPLGDGSQSDMYIFSPPVRLSYESV